jgi:predicted TIM-barrel fold metal-dependent hydrolase
MSPHGTAAGAAPSPAPAEAPVAVDDLILVSVDDHVVEPGNLFAGRLPAKYVDEAPKLVRGADGNDVWTFQGQVLPNIGLNAVAGRPAAEYGADPTSFDEMRPGCYDIDARVADMNANGVLGSMCFPSFPQFCGQLFARTKDKDLALALVRAYNDWHIETWCGTYPGRFIPLAIPPLWDPHLMAAEVRRVAAKGCHAVTFSENPEKLKHPSFHSDHWDPFWEACQDEGTVVCLHIGSSSELVITSVEAPINVMITLQPVNIVQAAADLVWSRVLHTFPDLRFALSEGGIGWIPYFLERADYVYRHHREWTGADLGGHLPSELFLEHVICCFIDDKAGLAQRGVLNPKLLTWECDYPHSDSTWPRSPEVLAPSLAGLRPEEVERITHRNAMELFRFDPFAHRPRERATVGALRAEAAAAGVDVATVARTGAAPRDPAEGPVTVLELTQRVAATPA